jgi:hypothetical protein
MSKDDYLKNPASMLLLFTSKGIMQVFLQQPLVQQQSSQQMHELCVHDPFGSLEAGSWSQLVGKSTAPYLSTPSAALCRYPEWRHVLPADLSAALPHGAAPPGFMGQLARLTLHLEELVLPDGDDLHLERPKMAGYSCTYHLPGQCILAPSEVRWGPLLLCVKVVLSAICVLQLHLWSWVSAPPPPCRGNML